MRQTVRGLLYGVACAAALAAGPVARADTVSLAQAQSAAFAAVQAGDDATAAAIARDILAAQPQDALAEFVLTVVSLRSGNLPQARSHGRRAYRLADTKQQKFQAAMIAADVADREGRPVALRFWLRQAADQAPNDKLRQATLRVLNEERARTPLSYGLSFSLAPSSNVNNGSSSPYSVIDGLPIVGVISEEGQALSGWEGSVRLSLGWKLAETDRTRTELTSTLSVYRVALSDAARQAAPDLAAGDLGDTVLMLGLRHSFLTADNRSKVELAFEAGRGWAGTDTTRDLFELSLRQTRDLGQGRGLAFGIAREWTDPEIETRADTRRTTLSLGYGASLASGDRVFAEVLLANTEAGAGSDRTSRKARTAMARVVWSKDKPVGPFSLSVSAGVQVADYPDYRLGFITVPGGRQDVTGFAEVALGMDDLSMAGFRPVLSVRGMTTDSNVSIFTTRDLSLGLGLSAEF